ncbi:DUF6197 family protein [Micromonospora craniellae]|nr:hypothetical protein [Micromonospora craniellae]QOC90244.1 hypothetical protein ID554_18840 [Micromonospora craniellae]
MKATHPPTDLQVTSADLLRMAARYLELRGWTQGNPYESGEHPAFPPACTLGAITLAVYGTPTSIESQQCGDPTAAILRDNTVRCLADFLWHDGRTPDFDSTSGSWTSTTEIVAEWNDEPTQTLTDVLDILHAAADEWDRLHITGGEKR